MRVVRNVGYLNRRKRISRWTVFFGVLGLALAMLMVTRPELIIPAYGVLIVGFLVFNAGMQQITKWNRSPRADEVLDQLLRRLNDRYAMIHFPEMGGWRPEHVLISPAGMIVITPRAVPGKIEVEGEKWTRKGNFFVRFFGLGGPQLGNPTIENVRQRESLYEYLTLNDLPGKDHIDGVIVFLNPRSEIEVIESDISVAMADELLSTIRDFGAETNLANDERKEIVSALAQGENVEGPVSLPSRDPNARAA
ncbi:MAG: NERD domain-containing protein [Sphaerobacteraceae bacterium]|nr:MAG: NERD domain-containing protein [Sphaerobacteraceae bacterium]